MEECRPGRRRPEKLNKNRLARYSRHLKIPEIGEAGQLKLLQSKVLLVGAGGLGSPAGVYLAASGVGTIGLIDSDVGRRIQPSAADPALDIFGRSSQSRFGPPHAL